MRATEFLSESDSKTVTINIPINITIPNGGGNPVVSTDPIGSEDLPDQPVFVSPLQQSLELEKHKSGKRSTVINQILDDNGAASEDKMNERTEFDISEDFDELSREFNRLSESKKLL
jgi:predicted nucleic acid binding AN1-type Zn finger protein